MIVNLINLGALELLLLLPFLAWFALFAIAFVKCLRNPNFSPMEKGIWILVICVFPLLGAIAYLVSFGGKPGRNEAA